MGSMLCSGSASSVQCSASVAQVAPSRNLTCGELSVHLLQGCTGALVKTLNQQHAHVVETVVLAAEAGRAAQWWQLAAFTMIAGSLLYHHGRWIAWISLSMALLSMQALYVGWQMGMIVFNVVLCACARMCALAGGPDARAPLINA